MILLKGIILGFSIAAPVGPIGVLCIRKTLSHGRLAGLCNGLGAALADTCYGAIAAFGLSLLAQFLIEWRLWLQIGGGLFLLYLGFRIFREKLKEIHLTKPPHTNLLLDCISTFFLTLSNPLTILTFLGIFASIGLANIVENYYYEATLLVIGVFLGSALWWLILAETIVLFRKKVTHAVLVWINRIAGLVIILFGLIVLGLVLL